MIQRAALGMVFLVATSVAMAIPPPEMLCSGKNDNSPAFLTRDDLAVATNKNGSLAAKYIEVTDAERAAICAAGVSLAVMPKPVIERTEKLALGRQKALPTMPYVPTSFDITGLMVPGFTGVLGSFWVPGTMPGVDNAHLSRFTISQTGFEVDWYNNGKHFVHMLTTSSFSNIATDYHGKGLIFGLYGFYCSPGSYGAISETFFYPVDTSVTPIGATRVWSGGSNGSPAAGPVGSTCIDWIPTTSYDVLAGANRSQGSVYYYKTAGAGSWLVTDVINDVVSTFRTGYSGVTYFVASDDTKPPGNWVLHFTNAQSWTQP